MCAIYRDKPSRCINHCWAQIHRRDRLWRMLDGDRARGRAV